MKPTVYVESLKILEREELQRLCHERRLPPALRLEERGDGRLWAVRGGDECAVTVRRLFPWSMPARYVSIRDEENNEVALVRDVTDLDSESSAVLQRALAEAGFVMEIVRVIEIDEEIEIRNWSVETCQGPRTFQTKLDDWPRELPGGGMLIPDVGGDLYLVSDPTALDPASRKLLWAFVD